MGSPDKPAQLFDFALSNASPTLKKLNQAYLHGCEIITTGAAKELDAMLNQLEEDGWHVLLIEIPGFKGSEWINKGETLKAIIQQFAPQQARTWVYLLGGPTLAALVKMEQKTELVGFVQKLASALSSEQGSPRTRLMQIPSQSHIIREYLAAQNAAAVAQRNQLKIAEKEKKIAELSFTPNQAALVQRNNRLRPSILLVEDDPSTLQLLKHLVTHVHSAEVSAATNAADAAQLYRNLAPDMVFLDIGLPEIDGLTILAKIKEVDPSACIVILTANAYRQNLEQATRLGAKGFLAKPFTPAKISEVIKKVIG